jgi:hypothetical protein
MNRCKINHRWAGVGKSKTPILVNVLKFLNVSVSIKGVL